jgi:hypothetical protein
MSKQLVINAIQDAAKKLGRAPSVPDLERVSGITREKMRKHFASMRQAVRAAGLEPGPEMVRNRSGEMLEDWGEVARKIGRLPSTKHYDMAGKYSKATFWNRFGPWNTVAEQFRLYVQGIGAEEKWRDVLEMIEKRKQGISEATLTDAVTGKVACAPAEPIVALPNIRRRCPIFPDRPVYGAPLRGAGMAYAPTNEMHLAMLFGRLAPQLGFHIERVQTAFPDCEALREMQPGKWQRVRIELEFESRNFMVHKHPMDGCDIIVCWRHNWPECPAKLEVIELRLVIG